MKVNGTNPLSAALVELPAQLANVQLKFAEKMLKAAIVQQAVSQADSAQSKIIGTWA